MAIVKNMTRVFLATNSRHTTAAATYSIVDGPDGERVLQIDTYGSADRMYPGKKSQSLRFSGEALEQLRRILNSEV